MITRKLVKCARTTLYIACADTSILSLTNIFSISVKKFAVEKIKPVKKNIFAEECVTKSAATVPNLRVTI